MGTTFGQNPGQKPGGRLSNFLSSVIDYTDHASKSEIEATRAEHEDKMGETPMSQTRKSSILTGAAITTLVSLIALLFSGYSFYETVLKQPTIKMYAPPLIHMYRKDFKDILAIPVTLSNDGARRGTVLAFDLEVKNPATGKSMDFRAIYFGNNPKDTSRIFTPLTIAGRSSISEIVMFEAEKTGAFFETTGGVELELHLKLTPKIDRAEYWSKRETAQPLDFKVQTGFIRSFNDMERGQPTVLRAKTR